MTETENSYEDLYSFLSKHKKRYAEEFRKKAAWPDNIKFPVTKEQLTVMLSDKKNIAFADLIGKELRKHGITLSEFNKMRKKRMINLTEKEVEILKAIRDAVPRPDKDTMLQKIIPVTDIKKYMGENGFNTIRGYVSKRSDVDHLKTYEEVLEALRLDYVDADGNRTYPAGGCAYGYIKFRTSQVDDIGIPYGKKFGGNNTDSWPCTLNGFLGAEDDIIPEWVVLGEGLEIKDGAELHRVVNGRDTIVGIFSDGHFISK